MSHYTLAHLEEAPRNELHDLLHLTAAEISRNTLPAGGSVPFVHRHRKKEESYLVLDGRGTLYIDGEELPLRAGDCFRIDPAGARCLRAADDSPLSFICVQARAGSLEGFTGTDGLPVPEEEGKPGWL